MGQPVVVAAALCNKCSALVIRKDGPVHQVADLRGRRIGYVPGTMHEILLRELLTRNGLSPTTDVTLVRVDFFDMGTALARGQSTPFSPASPSPPWRWNKAMGGRWPRPTLASRWARSTPPCWSLAT
ncbi:MAG: ABC transporter substrate-binding protein [Desulfobulbus sp.]|nr:ABC transporter substrate-binding protein [Desulfobulbus sp.]